ncbi:hypothetical protein HK104_008229 [Borealophlyctis nickersoniae]|nr:hypothetical protein HK104_008229 [Borealophlyctis nickersoniae]
MKSTASVAAVLALAASTAAQTQNSVASNEAGKPVQFTLPCGADLLLDDFSQERIWTAPPPSNEVKRQNALGGDWGMAGGNFTINPTAKTMTITPAKVPTPWPAEAFNPGTVPTFNYFYTQFTDQRQIFNKACANLTAFEALELEVTAPAGFDFNITYTQRARGDCDTRIFDSVYRAFTSYYKTPGVKATIRLPFSDFSKDLSGADFNYAWNKDITLINLVNARPTDSLVVSRATLKGRSCSSPIPGGNSSTNGTTGSGSPSNSSSNDPTKNQGNSGNSLAVGLSAVVGAVGAAFAALF